MQHLLYTELLWEQNTHSKAAWVWQNAQGGGIRYWSVPKGEKFPEHTHLGYEHIMVLKGSVNFSGNVLEQGDFLLTEAGEYHAMVALEDSVILVVSERSNQAKNTQEIK